MANLETPIPLLKLNDGASIPMLGYGTGTAWYKSSNDTSTDRKLVESIKTALKMGYNHIDGAETYNTEAEIGAAIKESKVPRKDLYVTTKVLQSVKDVPGYIDAALKRLQLDYVDLLLIHQPFFAKSDEELQKAWADLEDVKASGKARSIGVSNFYIPHLEAILKTAKVKPAINQIEFHPYLQHSSTQPSLLNFHREQGIAVSAYGPLTAVTRAAPGPVDEFSAALAKKYFVSEGEIHLRWCIDQDIVPITTSSKEQRMSDYLRVTRFSLTPKEVEELSKAGLEKHYRAFWGEKFADDDRT